MKKAQVDQTSLSLEQWEQAWQDTLTTHFSDARSRVARIHRRHLSSLKAVCLRHWRHKKDIPRDWLNLPIGLWHIARLPVLRITQGLRQLSVHRLDGEQTPKAQSQRTTLTGKEQQLLAMIEHDLLKLPQLQQKAWQHLQQHPEFSKSIDDERLCTLLAPYSDQASHHRLSQGLQHLTITHEGARDLMLFVGLGTLGKSLGHSWLSSGAISLGATAASGVYISQQSWLVGGWLKLVGTPAWVTTIGAITGMGLVLLITPMISPMSEWVINCWKGKKQLHQLIDATEKQIVPKKDTATLAGHAGTFAQLLPDLVQMIKYLR